MIEIDIPLRDMKTIVRIMKLIRKLFFDIRREFEKTPAYDFDKIWIDCLINTIELLIRKWEKQEK